MLFLERRFLALIKHRLLLFKQTAEDTYAFRCPYCGDSQKKKSKTRGYIFKRQGSLFFYCHNCHNSKKFVTFLREQDETLYLQFVKERFEVTRRPDDDETLFLQEEPEVRPKVSVRYELPTLASLPEDHIAKRFVRKRRIPEEWLPRLYYAETFYAWGRKFTDRFNNIKFEERRIVIPFDDAGFQGRALDDKGVRYITIVTDKSKPFLFGAKITPPFYVVEGPFDAMFLPNALATGGGELTRSFSDEKEQCRIVYDNEPRNAQIVQSMLKAARAGFHICVWPASIKQKDINEMVLSGRHPLDIKEIIDKSLVSGMLAEQAIFAWAKCQRA